MDQSRNWRMATELISVGFTQTDWVASHNWTTVSEFILMGLPHAPEMGTLLFLLFLVIYLITIMGNSLVLVAIWVDPLLHKPMYFFLSNLSFLDFWFSTVTLPKMLQGFLEPHGTVISFMGCLVQLYFSQLLGSTECFLYTIMSYDRYLAICHPLHYSSIMDRMMTVRLAIVTWVMGFFHSLLHTSLTFHLTYCGPWKIDHFFCDPTPLLEIACTNTSINEAMIFFSIGVVALVCLLLILLSYGSILRVILKLGNAERRYNAFSTCASHFTAVACFYIPCVITYMRPHSKSTLDRIVSIFYTILTPLLNPLIYTLRNKEMKAALHRLRHRAKCAPGK
ncbi:olfactory receptor 10G4-like [Rhineura floridana]|uniref:olfactory receptor 10G4-like n=1 Tax=Rhineura floridana TaxID=261503 RepID=UPI002AC7F0AB|nr:olfactory receptor 10G4-like [Rhineura floridana]